MAIAIDGCAPLIQVFDMPASLHFYRNVLGFKVIEPNPLQKDDCDWVLLEMSGVQLMLNTAFEKSERPLTPDKKRMEAHADTCLYFGCPDVYGTYLYLKEKGLSLHDPVVTRYGFTAIYLTDPDGFEICFHWPLK